MITTNKAKTILVIDDKQVIRQSPCDQLEDLGYQVLTVKMESRD